MVIARASVQRTTLNPGGFGCRSAGFAHRRHRHLAVAPPNNAQHVHCVLHRAGVSEGSSDTPALPVPTSQQPQEQQLRQQPQFPQAYGTVTGLSGPAAMCPPIPTVRSRPVMPALPGPDDAPLTRDERVARYGLSKKNMLGTACDAARKPGLCTVS